MDLPFLMLVLLLTGIGVIMVFSASYATAYLQEDKSPTFYFFRQALFAAAGLTVMYITSKINYRPSAGCRSSPLGWLSCCSSRCSSPASTPAVPTA